jgi:hypothetical protein
MRFKLRKCTRCNEPFIPTNGRQRVCHECIQKMEVCPGCGGKKTSRKEWCQSCSRKEVWKRGVYDEVRNQWLGVTGKAHPGWDPEADHSRYVPDTKERRRMGERIRSQGCAECGMSNQESKRRWGKSLHLHHIDGNTRNDVEENLVALCNSCHPMIHGRKD